MEGCSLKVPKQKPKEEKKNEMSSESHQLHVAFFPYMYASHTSAMLDTVRLFAARDHIKSTVLTTPLNAPNIATSLLNCVTGASSTIDIHIMPFASKEAGLPEGLEFLNKDTSVELTLKFFDSTIVLKSPLEKFLEESKPDCLIADYFFSFATEVAAKFGIPRLVFRGIGVFAACAMEVIHQYEPYKSVAVDDEPFIIPTLPHKVVLTKSQTVPFIPNSEKGSFSANCIDAASKSYGEVFNSFYELEPDYFDYYRDVLKRRGWHIGPVSRVNKGVKETTASICEHECLEWLNSKKDDSVVYICFGSTRNFIGSQLREIAMALESSGVEFIWVVNKLKDDCDTEGFIDGFEERMKGKGLIMRGWAPQTLILEHRAVGGFVTHCGWNSILESVGAGVPMITWPIFAEQFLNEKLITDIFEIGVQVGSKQWSASSNGTFVTQGQIEAALKAVMEGEKAVDMRSKVKRFIELAKEALDEGGSSYCGLTSLIQELSDKASLT